MLRESSPFSPVQLGQLASFLSRLMTRSSSILVTADLFTEVLDRLTEDAGLREERQTALLDILSPDDSAWKHFHLEHLETRSRSAGFYRVLERLFERQERTDEILDCYLLDEGRQSLVFGWLARTRVSETVLLHRLRRLLELDSVKLSSLVLQYSDGSTQNSLLQQILVELDQEPGTLYTFLHSVVTQTHPTLHQSLYSRHLQLMCELHPEEVVHHLTNKDHHEEYDLAEALSLCSQHDIVEGQVYVLERLGRPRDAFQLLSARLEARMTGGSVSEVRPEVETVVSLCRRSEGLEEEWCSLLETVLAPLSHLQDQDKVSAWREVVQTVISAMIGHVDSSRVVSIILSHPGYSRTGVWGEVREVVGDMMDMARYEARMLERVVEVMRGEQAELNRRLVARRVAGVHSRSSQCVQPDLASSDQDRERVNRARTFLSVYNDRNKLSTFTPESVIKSETFPLKLKPPVK